MHQVSRSALVAVTIVIVVRGLSGVATETQSMSDAELQETLMRLEKEYWQAMEDRDAEGIRKIMGPDGIFVDVAAEHLDAQHVIDVIMRLKVDAVFEPRVLMRRLGPDAAVLAYDMKVRPDLETFAATAVYVRRGGQWIGIYHHEAIPRKPQAPSSPR